MGEESKKIINKQHYPDSFPTFRNALAEHKLEALATFLPAKYEMDMHPKYLKITMWYFLFSFKNITITVFSHVHIENMKIRHLHRRFCVHFDRGHDGWTEVSIKFVFVGESKPLDDAMRSNKPHIHDSILWQHVSISTGTSFWNYHDTLR